MILHLTLFVINILKFKNSRSINVENVGYSKGKNQMELRMPEDELAPSLPLFPLKHRYFAHPVLPSG